MAKLIKANGEVEVVIPSNGKKFELNELYKLIGCEYVQVVNGGKDEIIVLDEEGKLKEGAEINEEASLLYWKYNYPSVEIGAKYRDYVVGNVVVCKTSEF